MSDQPNRVTSGGLIDRSKPLSFSFDGKRYHGFKGDTLASALLANDVHLVARSFKYHRPRGIYAAGSEEPAALVTVGEGGRTDPNTRATIVELRDGLVARSQNAWPSVGFDIGAINNSLSRFFSAGFYYKTFMWPGLKGWRFYEHFIRRAAGMGRLSAEPDPDYYERKEHFCDLLIVGAGPAGIAAALTASESGARVLLVDENASPSLLAHPDLGNWASDALQKLGESSDVILLSRCTAFGYYDGNVVGMVERVSDHLAQAPAGIPRQRHWIVRARQTVLATGSIERPMLFENNDRPGVMLASAADRYLREYGVCPGRRIVLYTNNDSTIPVAERLREHADVQVVDAREKTIKAVRGGKRVQSVTLSDGSKHDCNLLLTSGGWTPTIHLHSQAGSTPVFDEQIQSFLPGDPREAWTAAGACNGEFDTAGCIKQGIVAATAALASIGLSARVCDIPELQRDADLLVPPSEKPRGKCFVDIQNDVTIDDLEQGVSEGYRSAELLKRYTTLGMGTDQGKTSNVNALALLAASRGEPVPAIGVTTFRPPYSPVAIGAIAGSRQGLDILPTRLTPLHTWHEKHAGQMNDSGLWKRPDVYIRAAEDRAVAGARESARVRSSVGVCDVSTLGKIDIQGPDTAEFLERVYINRWQSLKPGKARYGVMLREDGFVFDDGTTSRLADNRYFMTTSTANVSDVLRHLEFCLQVTWPDLRVVVSDVTEQWAAFSVAGQNSREVLGRLLDDAVDNESLPFMGIADFEHRGKIVRVIRVSFSGELGFELYTPSNNGIDLVNEYCDLASEFDVAPYGLDAMDVLRIEKGHVTGAEIDGNRTLADLGLDGLARPDRSFIGGVMMQRAALADASRPTLVGLMSADTSQAIKPGAHLVNDARQLEPANSLGEVSSACYSPTLQRHIGLGFLRNGRDRHGSKIYVTNPVGGEHFAAEVVSPHFFDPKGERVRG